MRLMVPQKDHWCQLQNKPSIEQDCSVQMAGERSRVTLHVTDQAAVAIHKHARERV